ncbi:alpha/beta fold hydrolase [Pseudonocardia bannensis]|uniref:Alpha/beta fold hydrolase n=1 Tax=Pseudonocardia bannensis TaxID=630973 RepID=A0A848DMG4_9PSEU|nr:alpha/beta fold hydrolase [Pseudonocardia bannensis]NMH93621.1 alpha/beta fold hydrolase [Pseudonocardia bannensis]
MPLAALRLVHSSVTAEPRTVPLADAGSLARFDERWRPWPGREVTAGGVTLHVRETPGPDDVPAVFVHGLSGSATNWTDLAGLLAPRAAGTAVDLPGFGLSRPLLSRDYSPAAHADALLCFLAGRGRPVHLLGNSLGGVIALTVAARRPELVRTLTLVSPAMPDRRPDPRRMSDPRMALAMVPGLGRRARAQLAAASPRARAEQVVRLCFGDPSLAPEHRLAEAAEEIVARGRQPWAGEAVERTALGMFASWAGRGLWATAARVSVPTLVVWGDRDRLISPRLATRTVRSLRRGKLLMLPGVGHIAQIEAAQTVARAVAGMWDAVERGEWEDPA